MKKKGKEGELKGKFGINSHGLILENQLDTLQIK